MLVGSQLGSGHLYVWSVESHIRQLAERDECGGRGGEGGGGGRGHECGGREGGGHEFIIQEKFGSYLWFEIWKLPRFNTFLLLTLIWLAYKALFSNC